MINLFDIVNETFDSVFDSEDAEADEEALVNQVYDEIGLEFNESVRIKFMILDLRLNLLFRLKPLHQSQLLHQRVKLQMKRLIDFWLNMNNSIDNKNCH